MRPARIAVVGNINMDAVIRVDGFPNEGETIVGRSLRWIPGGKAGNQAVAAARLGAEVAIVGCLGRDAFGDTLEESLRSAGIDCTGLRRSEDTHTGTAVVVVRGDGRNAIISCLGANMSMTSADVRGSDAVSGWADVVLVQLGVPIEVVEATLSLCGEKERMCFLDLSPLRSGPPRNWRSATVVSPNETEAGVILGGGAPDASLAPDDAAMALLAEGARRVVLKLGARGCVLADADGLIRIPSPAVDAVDTTGAGDAFMGGLAVGYVEAGDWAVAAQFACAAGALACTGEGAQASLPMRADVERVHGPIR